MKAKSYTLSFKIFSLVLLQIFCLHSKTNAEGTKEIRPDSAEYGNIQINDFQRPFALESNTDPFNRLYIHISDYVHEKVYLGFKHIQAGSETATFRIVNPSGTVVYPTTSPFRKTIPTSGAGYIKWYSKAVAGPIIGLTGNGYSPITFTPQTNGDFYIEFTTSYQGTDNAYHFDLFDITIANGSTKIPGRLWSYCWDLSTRAFDNGYYAKMYVLTDDRYVSKIDFNGIEAFGFTIACNNTGPGNLPGGNNENRKSIDGNHTRPQFKVFLNNPDINAYPSGTIPVVVQNLAVIGTPVSGQPVLFRVNISQPGIVQIVLDLNGISGYQPNSADVILVDPVHAGLDTIIWDEKDGFGNFVTGSATVSVLSSFASGTTHLPLYDPETHPNGYIVTRIRPSSGQCNLYWDDSNFPGGTVNIDGSLQTGHSWPYFFGDVRTMNTWWNGYELGVLNAFDFTIGVDMPVEFLEVKVISDNDHVNVNWSTASETNNDYFTIERSTDGMDFKPLSIVKGAGNSNTILNYNYADNNPIEGINYYRIKQTDFDGKFDYSEIKSMNYISEAFDIKAFPNPVNKDGNLNIVLLIEKKENYTASIYSITNQKIVEFSTNKSIIIPLNNSLNEGVYYLVISSGEKRYLEKIVIQ